MTLTALMFRLMAGRSDKKRDAGLTIPENVTAHRDISYANTANGACWTSTSPRTCQHPCR